MDIKALTLGWEVEELEEKETFNIINATTACGSCCYLGCGLCAFLIR